MTWLKVGVIIMLMLLLLWYKRLMSFLKLWSINFTFCFQTRRNSWKSLHFFLLSELCLFLFFLVDSVKAHPLLSGHSVPVSPPPAKLLTGSPFLHCATDGRCSLSNLGFNLGFFQLVISFTILPGSQGRWDTLTRAHAHLRAYAHSGRLTLLLEVNELTNSVSISYPQHLEAADERSVVISLWGFWGS